MKATDLIQVKWGMHLYNLLDFAGDKVSSITKDDQGSIFLNDGKERIRVNIGDWIFKTPDGELHVISDRAMKLGKSDWKDDVINTLFEIVSDRKQQIKELKKKSD